MQKFSFPAEFGYFRGILENFAQIKNSPAISTIFDLMTYFIMEKNQTELPKAVSCTNSYRNMAQS